MPIPVLKMKTVKKIADETRIAGASPKGAMSSRVLARPIQNCTNLAPPSSQIPSAAASPRDTKSRIATSKATRPSGIACGTRPSPRPPPRTSSAMVEPRYKARPTNTATREPMYIKNKTAPVKRIEYSGGASGVPKSTAQSANNPNSNRSSVVSNCSSIPPPSSSSSNRNSSSSISSNFSVGSWTSNTGTQQLDATTQDTPFACGGADTFPRASANASFRSRGRDEDLTKSMEEGSRLKNSRGSLPRPSMRYKTKESSSQVTLKSKMSSKQLSSSETAITSQSRIVLPVSNYSDTNLSSINVDRSKPRFGHERYISKPVAAIKGKTKSIPAPRVVNLEATKKPTHPDNVAFVTPFTTRTRTEPADKADNAIRDNTDDDDGYSSVANVDQSDEIYQKSADPSSTEDDDYDEVADIVPMRPLQMTKCYDFLKDTQSTDPIQAGPNEIPRISSGPDSSKLSNSLKNRPTNLDKESLKTAALRTKSLQRRNENAATDLPSKTSNRPLEAKDIFKVPSVPPHKRQVLPPASTQSADVSSTKAYTAKPFPKSEAASALDDAVLQLSYKDFVKRDTQDRGGYNWMTRNTSDGTLASESTRRKITFTDTTIPSAHTPTTVSNPTLSVLLDKRMTVSVPARRSLEIPQRPNSLNTDKLSHLSHNISDGNLFQRTGSLRSPSLDSTPETKITSFSSSCSPVTTHTCSKYVAPGSPGTFNRGTYKYSTVIPRTTNENRGQRDSAYSSGSPSECKLIEEGIIAANKQHDSESQIDQLKVELKASRESIRSLQEQVISSNKLVSAFDHSLTNMTLRLKEFSKVAEEKDAEICELRRLLEKSCTETNTLNFKSNTMGGRGMNRGCSIESLTSLISTDSISSSISTTSTTSNVSLLDSEGRDKHKKKSWLRSSFTKAFRRKHKRERDEAATDTEADMEHGFYARSTPDNDNKGYCSLPSSPLPQRYQPVPSTIKTQPVYHSEQQLASVMDDVSRLRITVQEKDSALTESRLESLSAAHQIESLKESIHKLSVEVTCLKAKQRNHTITQVLSQPRDATGYPSPSSEHPKRNSKSIRVTMQNDVNVRQWHELESLCIGKIEIVSTTSWAQLDVMVSAIMLRYFKEIDGDLQLCLNAQSISHYKLGEITKPLHENVPELLPFGYLVGQVDSVNITLRNASSNCIDALVFETCISKPYLQRYFSLLKDHRRVILSGPKGTGKTYLALRMAEFVIQRLGIEPSLGNVAKFQVNSDSHYELTSYLSHVSELCESKSPDLPLVIILEGLEKVDKLTEVLTTSLRIPHDQCPFIIGTARLRKNASNDLMKLHNNFRWVTLDPELEPMQGLLTRICRRQKLIDKRHYVESKSEMDSFLDWLPRCSKIVNTVLNGSSSSGSLGPSVFLPIPSTVSEAQTWFNEVWQSCLLPLIQKAAENAVFIPQDIQVWNDLAKCLGEELPWSGVVDLPRPVS